MEFNVCFKTKEQVEYEVLSKGNFLVKSEQERLIQLENSLERFIIAREAVPIGLKMLEDIRVRTGIDPSKMLNRMPYQVSAKKLEAIELEIPFKDVVSNPELAEYFQHKNIVTVVCDLGIAVQLTRDCSSIEYDTKSQIIVASWEVKLNKVYLAWVNAGYPLEWKLTG